MSGDVVRPRARIAIVDDDPDAIDAVREALATSGREIVAFGTAKAALKALAERDLPMIVLMDMSLPGEITGDAIRAMRGAGRLVVALTSHEHPDFVFEAIRAGAVGYILKRRLEDLREALDVVESGGSPITPSVARRILSAFVDPREVRAGITDREREILRAFADGRTYGETARALGISIDTVREHVRRLYDKLQVRTRSEAVVSALKRGLLG